MDWILTCFQPYDVSRPTSKTISAHCTIIDPAFRAHPSKTLSEKQRHFQVQKGCMTRIPRHSATLFLEIVRLLTVCQGILILASNSSAFTPSLLEILGFIRSHEHL